MSVKKQDYSRHFLPSNKFEELLKQGFSTLNSIVKRQKTSSIFKNWSTLLRKRQWFYREEFEARPFFNHKGIFLSLRNWCLRNQGNEYRASSFVIFCVSGEAFLINFFDCKMKQGMQIFLSLMHLKIRLWNQLPMQVKLVRAS